MVGLLFGCDLCAQEPGFTTIFNGKDLTGWEGDDKAWAVVDGAIASTGGNTKKNWLIWRGGELRDFELRLSFKFTKGNSGVQVRSKEIDKWQVRGYQVEIADATKMGLWHHSLAPAKHRSHLATAGQRVRIGRDGKKAVDQRATPAEVQSICRDNDWNELVVTAVGPRLVQKINGVVFAELIDEEAQHAAQSGLLALQDHGKGCVAAFKNIRIKHLRARGQRSESNPAKPNVVVVFVDDLGWTDLGCYGSKFYESPNIARLAEQGAMFSRAYSSCNVCSPTRASLMTGKYPQRVGFTDWLNPRKPDGPNSAATHLPANEITLGEAFQQSGYRTGYIGKWHVGSEAIGMPKQHGFDWQMATARHGLPGSYFHPFKKKGLPSADVPDLEDGKPGDYLTDALTDKGIGFIKDTVDEGKQPFFLILGHYAVHTPIQAPKKLVEKYEAKKKRMYGDSPLKMIPERFNRKVPARQQNPTYAAMVENLDTNVGKVITALDELGVTKDTIIVFTSDNGGSCMPASRPTSNYPLRASKGWNYEGGIRIPTFITWPGKIPAMKTAEPVITMDIYPTLLELTSCEQLPKQTVDGRSLVPLFRGEKKTLGRPFLAWWYPHSNGHGTQPCQAILQDGWKLVHFMEQNETELYRLSDDEGERNDLAKAEPKKTREMLNTLNEWVEETRERETK